MKPGPPPKQQEQQPAAVEGAPETCEPLPVRPQGATTAATSAQGAAAAGQAPPCSPPDACFPHVGPQRVKGSEAFAGTGGKGYGAGE